MFTHSETNIWQISSLCHEFSTLSGDHPLRAYTGKEEKGLLKCIRLRTWWEGDFSLMYVHSRIFLTTFAKVFKVTSLSKRRQKVLIHIPEICVLLFRGKFG